MFPPSVYAHLFWADKCSPESAPVVREANYLPLFFVSKHSLSLLSYTRPLRNPFTIDRRSCHCPEASNAFTVSSSRTASMSSESGCYLPKALRWKQSRWLELWRAVTGTDALDESELKSGEVERARSNAANEHTTPTRGQNKNP